MGSVPFVTASSTTVTQVPTIAFPGVPGGIPYAIDLTVPVVDLFPADAALPPPLTIGPDQLSIATNVTITLGCITGAGDPKRGGKVTPVLTALDAIAIANPVSQYFSPGVGYVSFHVDQVLVLDVAPASLQAVLDCLLDMILNALLSGLQLPFNIIDAGFVKLILQAFYGRRQPDPDVGRCFLMASDIIAAEDETAANTLLHAAEAAIGTVSRSGSGSPGLFGAGWNATASFAGGTVSLAAPDTVSIDNLEIDYSLSLTLSLDLSFLDFCLLQVCIPTPFGDLCTPTFCIDFPPISATVPFSSSATLSADFGIDVHLTTGTVSLT